MRHTLVPSSFGFTMCTVIHTSLQVHMLLVVMVMLSPWFCTDAQRWSAPRFKHDIIPNKLAMANGSSKFVCKARGYPRPMISWYYNNELISYSPRIKITKYSLKVSRLKTSDGGKYACKVENEHGFIWGNFTLEVLVDGARPRFHEGITRVTYIVRAATSEVDLDCSADAFPATKITWWRDDNIQIEEKVSKYIFEEFKLKILSLTLDDVGNYTCVVSNEHGNISHQIHLQVQQRVLLAPLLEDVNNQTALEGDNVTFTCQIIMSDSPPLIQWLKHYKVNDTFMNERGEPYVKLLQQSGYLRTIDDGFKLILYNVSKEDEGWYTCLAANTVGMNYRSAWLDINAPPSFHQGVNRTTYTVRGATLDVTLDCSARAHPAATITWWKNGNIQIHETEGKYLMVDSRLNILSLNSDDKGNYTCVVSNKHGNISQTIPVEEQGREVSVAVLMDDMENQIAFEGGNATFTCQLLMTWSNSLLYWIKHKTVDDFSKNKNGHPYMKLLKHTGYIHAIHEPQELVLYNLSKEDEGWYTCLVANEDGMSYRSAWLEVLNAEEL